MTGLPLIKSSRNLIDPSWSDFKMSLVQFLNGYSGICRGQGCKWRYITRLMSVTMVLRMRKEHYYYGHGFTSATSVHCCLSDMLTHTESSL